MSELAHDPKNLKRSLNRYGEESESLIKRNGYPPKYWKRRPSFGKDQVKTVWENKAHGKDYFINENSELITWNKDISRNGQWDMGHLPAQKYSDMYDRFLMEKMSEQEFLEWYRDAGNYELQTIPFNRGHKGE